jgi:dTDP-4-dehydrorhamnose reductase
MEALLVASSTKWAVDNLDTVPQLLHLSGTDILSYYEFYQAVLNHYELDVSKLHPRNKELKLATPRPLRAGLNVSLAKKLGVPLYSAFEGIKAL